ncbi:MAG: hypothetical protein LBJ38_02015 [Oscillospiraceae bacterium]|nr:hypothetical protein [Oscillospiraceae bacterium]
MGLEKAKLIASDGKELEVQFNPDAYSIESIRHVGKRHEGVSGTGKRWVVVGVCEKSRILSFQLHFYCYVDEGIKNQVIDKVKSTGFASKFASKEKTAAQRVDELRGIVAASQEAGLTFLWGSVVFHGYVLRMLERVMMFTSTGAPVWVVVEVEIVETPELDGAGIGGSAPKEAKSLIGKVRSMLP